MSVAKRPALSAKAPERSAHIDAIAPPHPFDPSWCLVVDTGPDEELARVAESLLCVADGTIGTRGVLEHERDPAVPPVAVAGMYVPAERVGERLMGLASWCVLPLDARLPSGRRLLDLREGIVIREVGTGGAQVRTMRFACVARPGTAVLVADVAPEALTRSPATEAPQMTLQRSSPLGGGVTVAYATTVRGPDEDKCRVRIERVATHLCSQAGVPGPKRALRRLTGARRLGVTGLLAEQRAVWERRWTTADVEVLGDAETTLAVRFAVFHLLSSAHRRGEAAVGARGLTGPAYAGHVFWDTEAFVLPVLAATDPPAARAVLEYRVRRLPAARSRAASMGRSGARFPWESASNGGDVTPRLGIDQHGETVPIRTGDLEEHVTAVVAWAAWRYAAWSGDWSFLTGPGRPLLVETARYWFSRLCWDDGGRAHIGAVTGPDEYHEDVDDNAFTNVMARWNLRRGADVIARGGDAGEAEEAEQWREAAEALVDSYDRSTGRYEQFAGYDLLHPLLATDLGHPPLAADLALGTARLAQTQIIKQADVLMSYFLVPEEVAAGSLRANFDHYLPRTSHGSSLSPSVHAALAARAGRADEGLELLRLATSIDLEDLTETTAGGLHLANLGGIWQAVVHGFAGVRLESPDAQALSVDPVLPEAWDGVGVRLCWRGHPIRLVCRRGAVYVGCEEPVAINVYGTKMRAEPPGRWVG